MTLTQILLLPLAALIALHLATGTVFYLLITFLICDTKPGRIFTALCICVWPIVLTLLAVLLVEELLAYIGAQLWARLKDKLK